MFEAIEAVSPNESIREIIINPTVTVYFATLARTRADILHPFIITEFSMTRSHEQKKKKKGLKSRL